MTREEFIKLSLYDKQQYIWTEGKYIDYREYFEVTLQLYSVGNNFYEVYFVGEDNEITQIKEVDIAEVIIFYDEETKNIRPTENIEENARPNIWPGLDDLIIREYNKSDKEHVLQLLKLNTPEFFSVEEESQLNFYLDNKAEHYYVLEINHLIIGSGGFNFSEKKLTGVLSWDILHPDFQGKSLGSIFAKYRIQKLQDYKEVQKIIVRTSQHS